LGEDTNMEKNGELKMTRKLSEIILEMIKPYHKGSSKHIESLVSLAATSWNMTMVSQEEATKTKAKILNICQGDIEQIQTIEALIVKFMMVKLEQYSHDNRFIINYQVDTSCEPPSLNIASVPFGDGALRDSGGKINVGRNDPCPCGSGKKYKKCCGE